MQNQPPPGYQPGSWQQSEPYQPPMPPAPTYPSYAPPRTQTFNFEPNVAGGLCYIPFFLIHFILPVVFLATEPKSSRFVRFHSLQALFLGLTGIVGGIACYVAFIVGIILAALAAAVSPVLGLLVGVVGLLALAGFGIFMLVCTVIACIKAFSGEMWKVPVVGSLAERCL